MFTFLYHCCSYLVPNALLLQILFTKSLQIEAWQIKFVCGLYPSLCSLPPPFNARGCCKKREDCVHKWMLVKTPEWPWCPPQEASSAMAIADVIHKEAGRLNGFRSPSISSPSVHRTDCRVLLCFVELSGKRCWILHRWLLQLRMWDEGVIFSIFCVLILLFDLLIINIQRNLRSQLHRLTDRHYSILV